MPGWLAFLLPWALKLVASVGLPAVEAKWPGLKPIIDEILAVVGGNAVPTAHLTTAATNYNVSKSNVSATK